MSTQEAHLRSDRIRAMFLVAVLSLASTAAFSAPTTARMSVASDGAQANYHSNSPSISADGRIIVFSSAATNLVLNDTNEKTDIFVHDRQTGQTTRVNISSSGEQADGEGFGLAAITADGRYVAFVSGATNLVPGDGPDPYGDVFVHDRVTGQTTCVSLNTDGTPANRGAESPAISADGRYIAFATNASLIQEDLNNDLWDAYVYDRQTGTTGLITAGAGSPSSLPGVAISADGRYVAFGSYASDLVPNDTNNAADVFRHDRETGQTIRVSIASGGAQANQGAGSPVISADGRYVAFVSNSSNLATGDWNDAPDVFVRDIVTGTTKAVSVRSNGATANGASFNASMSADGRYIAFDTEGTDVVPDVALPGAFARDMVRGRTARVSVSHDGTPATGGQPSISADGRYVTFVSGDTHIVPGDTNEHQDVFVRGSLTEVFLAFTTSPGTARPGEAFSRQPVVKAQNAYGLVDTSYSGPVTVAIKPGTGAPGAVLSGTATVNAVNGVANFAGLSIDRSGTYRLTATGSLPSGDSLVFNIVLPRVYLRPDGNDAYEGSSWATARKTLAAAIDLAERPGGEVWAAAGEYQRAEVPAGVSLYGGFNGTEAAREERNWRLNRSVVIGSTGEPVLRVGAGADSSTVIDGFTLRDGVTGLLCSSASPTIAHNRIVGNGGGSVYGNGIECYQSSPVIRDNVITGSFGEWGSAAIRCENASPQITGNTLVGNGAAAITCGGASTPVAVNNIIAFNGAGIRLYAPSSITLQNNCVFGNAHFDYNGLSDHTGTQGNISADPKLASTAFGDMHLQPESPCRNAGNSSVAAPGAMDLDGEQRVQGVEIDIGADESDGTDHVVTPRIVRVSPSGSDASDGSSWAVAMRTVQAGLDAVADEGGEVWVAAGEYHERITLDPFRHLYGGFAGTETARDQRNETTNTTILDGDQGGTVVTLYSGYRQGTVAGFTIRNGYSSDSGGGVACPGSAPTIADNIITGNSAVNLGGGVYCNASAALITNNTVENNTTGAGGGGIYSLYGAPTITGNTITGNGGQAGGIAGGICIASSGDPGREALISDNLLAANQGVGVGCVSSRPTIQRNRIVDNTQAGVFAANGSAPIVSGNLIARNGEGGIASGYGATATVVGNTIVGNLAGAGIAVDPATMDNNIVAFNASGAFVYPGRTPRSNCVFGNTEWDWYDYDNPSRDLTGTNGNIKADPLFVDRANDNYRLTAASPCVDAGRDASVPVGATDLEGTPRIVGAHVDIGAYEFTTAAAPFTMAEAGKALRVWSGLLTAVSEDLMRLNVEQGGESSSAIDLRDAARIARKAAGLESNP